MTSVLYYDGGGSGRGSGGDGNNNDDDHDKYCIMYLFLFAVDANAIEEFLASKYADYSYSYVDDWEIQDMIERANLSKKNYWNAKESGDFEPAPYDAMLK